MEKDVIVRVFSNPMLRKIITVISIAFLIIVVGTPNVLARTDGSNVSAIASETGMQQFAVSGKITDATTGEALAGVNVKVEGTTIGAISDIDGKYSFPSVDRNASLTFSFIGYVTQVVPIAGRNVVNATLVAETQALQEVVVIGYGTQRKETLTGSVASIKTADILSTKSTSVASSIQGKIVGVQIRQQTGEPGVFNSRISIRGFGEPLLVIDGVVRDGMTDLERLNPDDIENMSVLKDASASIYGMNAANGVIIVTTKKGFAGKTEFTLSSLYTSKKPTNDFNNLTADAYTLRVMQNEMQRNSNIPLGTSDTELAKWKDGTLPGYTDYNWWKEFVKDHVNTSDLNLTARGGNDVITFFTSLGYMNDGGYFKVSDAEQYKKYTFRTNVEAKLAKGLTLKVSFYGRSENTIQPSAGTQWTFKRIITNNRGVGAFTLANNGHLSIVPAENTNIWGQLSKEISGYDQNINFQYQSTVDLNYELPFVKGLSLGVLVAYDGLVGDRRQLNKTFQLYDYITDAPSGTPGLNTFANTLTNMVRKDIQNKISYKTRIGDHNISATVVNEIKRIDYNNLYGKRQFDDVFTTDIINQGSLTNQSTTGYRTEEAYVSFLGRFSYDYKAKYLLDFTIRADGTYRYAPGQQWGTFPAVSAGWRIGQESFIKDNLPIVSDLKLRGSWGKSGRDAGLPFGYYEGYSFGKVDGGYVFNDNILTMGMIPPGIVNGNLTWVHTTTTDFGLDLELWKGKLGFTTDYFQRLEEGLLATRVTTLPNTLGASFPEENLNSQITRGFELSVSHKNTIGKFSYGVNANMTLNRLYFLHREQAAYQSTMAEWKSGTDGDGRIQGRIFGPERTGEVWQNVTELETAPLQGGVNGNSLELPGMDKIRDIDGNGVINGNDVLPNGFSGAGTNPPLQAGLNANANYLNFDFNVGVAGGTMFSMSKSRSDQWGYGMSYPMFFTKYLDHWHTANVTDNPFDPATVWIPGKWEAVTANTTGNTSGSSTDKWRMDATYLRVKTIELGYTIPSKITKVIKISSCRAFVNCYNLFTLCNQNLKDMDPEKDEGAYSAGNTYPIMRSYNFGLDIKF